MKSTGKKVGIITYWESNDNYGQQLQCWALQHFLRERGFDAFLIRQYVCPEQYKKNKKGIKRIKQWVKDAIADILYATNLAYKPYVYKRFAFLDKEVCLRQFPKFRKEHLKMSKIYDTPEKLMSHSPRADVYIAGSDQIWHANAPIEWLEIALLHFGDKGVKRIAYAPSMPFKNLSDEQIRMFKSYMPSLSSISTRETSSTEYLRALGFDSQVVLDPTLLLRAEDYYKLYRKEKAKKNVFIYSINYTNDSEIPIESIKQYAKLNGLDVVVTTSSGYEPSNEIFSGVRYEYATIPKWLKSIEGARLVVTPSFHGVVFAILLHTPFMYTPLIGKYSRGNERITELLGKLDLLNCIWDGKTAIDSYANMPIDWDRVEILLEGMKEQSKKYLSNALKCIR